WPRADDRYSGLALELCHPCSETLDARAIDEVGGDQTGRFAALHLPRCLARQGGERRVNRGGEPLAGALLLEPGEHVRRAATRGWGLSAHLRIGRLGAVRIEHSADPDLNCTVDAP